MTVGDDLDEAAFAGDGVEFFVGKIARVVDAGADAGVGGEDGGATEGDGLQYGFAAHLGDVDNDAEGVEFAEQGLAEGREAVVAGALVAQGGTGTGGIGEVIVAPVNEAKDAEPAGAPFFDFVEGMAEGVAVDHADDGGEEALAPEFAGFGGSAGEADGTGHGLGEAGDSGVFAFGFLGGEGMVSGGGGALGGEDGEGGALETAAAGGGEVELAPAALGEVCGGDVVEDVYVAVDGVDASVDVLGAGVEGLFGIAGGVGGLGIEGGGGEPEGGEEGGESESGSKSCKDCFPGAGRFLEHLEATGLWIGWDRTGFPV